MQVYNRKLLRPSATVLARRYFNKVIIKLPDNQVHTIHLKEETPASATVQTCFCRSVIGRGHCLYSVYGFYY